MNDGQLFDAPVVPISAMTGKPVAARARNTDPKSSHDAAERVNVSKGRADVLIVLDEIGAATGDQVRDEMRRRGIKVSDSGPRSRLAELRKEYEPAYVYIVRRADNQAVYATTDRGHTAANDLRAAQGQEAA